MCIEVSVNTALDHTRVLSTRLYGLYMQVHLYMPWHEIDVDNKFGIFNALYDNIGSPCVLLPNHILYILLTFSFVKFEIQPLILIDTAFHNKKINLLKNVVCI